MMKTKNEIMMQVLAGEEMAVTMAQHTSLRNGIWDAEKYPVHASRWDEVDAMFIDLGGG